MPYFVVTCERGPSWDWSRPMRGQDGWDAHAAFMDALVAEGFIVAGGPLGGEDDARRVLHIVFANDARGIERRLAQDPWTPKALLHTLTVEPWTVLLGGFGAASSTSLAAAGAASTDILAAEDAASTSQRSRLVPLAR